MLGDINICKYYKDSNSDICPDSPNGNTLGLGVKSF